MHPIDGERSPADTFVGRERELVLLRESLARVRSGRGGLVILSGEAGIGKTRLVEAFAEDARRSGCLVRWSRCHAGEGIPAYLPWIRLLRGWRDDSPTEGDVVPHGLAELAASLGTAARHDLDAGAPSPVFSTARFRLFDAVADTLAQLARRLPVVLVLDDLHCADAGSLRLLEFILHALDHTRVLVVGTLREPPPPPASAAEVLARLSTNPETLRLPLAGLATIEVEELVATSTGQREPGFAERLHTRTGGNPFFVAESLRLLDTAAPRSGAIPPAVGDVLRQRLDRLSAPARRALAVAAVIGTEFDLPLLAALLERPRPDVASALDAAAAARFVVPLPGEPGCWRFAHDLAREAIYADLAGVERARLHARVGEALLTRHGDADERRLAPVAHHFTAAVALGDMARAVEYVVRAAAAATRRLAYEEAANGYGCALGLLDREGDRDLARRCALELARGDAQTRAGDTAAARETFLRAARLGRRVGAPDLLALAALGVGSCLTESGSTAGNTDGTLVALLREASGLDTNHGLRARVLARLARALADARERDEPSRLSGEAVGLARQLGDRATLAVTLSERHQTLVGPDDLLERLATSDEIVRLAGSVDDGQLALWGHTYRMVDLLEKGDAAGATAAAAARERLAAAVPEPQHRYYSLLFCATWATLSGRFEEAERAARDALALGQRMELPDARVAFTLQLGVIRQRQGRLPELALDPGAIPARMLAHPAWRAGLAFAYVMAGQPEAARSEVEQLASSSFADLPRDSSWLAALAVLTDVFAFLDDSPHAAQLYDLLQPYADRVVVLGFGFSVLNTVAYCLARLAATLRRWDDALAHVEAARVLDTRLGARPLLVLDSLLEGFVRLARGTREDQSLAGSCLDDALRGARELGMANVVKRIEAHLDTAAPRVAPREASAATAPRLVRREGAYWTFVFDGALCRVRDAKGLDHVATLLRHPNREFHALDLLFATGDERPPSSSDLGPSLDGRARAEYRRRLGELRDEQADAERCHDVGRAARAAAEIETVVRELGTAMGLGGRARRTGSHAERARLVVTKRIKAAVASIRAVHPRLGHHLATSVRTGVLCVYTEPPGERAAWRD